MNGLTRLPALIEDASRTLDKAIREADRPVVAVVALFSGLERARVPRAAHSAQAVTGSRSLPSRSAPSALNLRESRVAMASEGTGSRPLSVALAIARALNVPLCRLVEGGHESPAHGPP